MKKGVYLLLGAGVCLFLAIIAVLSIEKEGDDIAIGGAQKPSEVVLNTPSVFPKAITPPPSTPSLSALEEDIIESDVLLKVPFVVQAPKHNWSDIIYQNACEEAAILMAMRWVEDRSLTKEEAFVEIKKLSDFSQEKYGFHLDQSAKDVARLMRDYFDYKKIEYRENINTADIARELRNGNLVLVPVNGRKLGNPFFTPPGPIEHMLVIKGYDSEKDEFITNDSGIGKGDGYRYKESVLNDALQAYPTGYHEPIKAVKRVMIVVSKN